MFSEVLGFSDDTIGQLVINIKIESMLLTGSYRYFQDERQHVISIAYYLLRERNEQEMNLVLIHELRHLYWRAKTNGESRGDETDCREME